VEFTLISERERFIWLGTILADDARPMRFGASTGLQLRCRVCPASTVSASAGSRIRLAFDDTADGIEAWEDALVEFNPDTIGRLAQGAATPGRAWKLPARGISSGAEVLDPLDRAVIEDATGRTVREIYMAT